MRGTIYNLSALALGLLLGVGCKSQKPVGLTKIPTMTPIVKTVTVPGPAQPLGGGNPLPGGNPLTGGNPTGGSGGTTIVEIPQDPLNQALGNGFNGNEVEDRDMFLAQICLLYTSPSPRDKRQSRMPSSA